MSGKERGKAVKSIVAVDMTITRDGEEKEITVDGYVHYHEDRNYGSDADGNRGELRIFIDDITEMAAWNDQFEQIKLTDPEIEKANELLKEKFFNEG